MARLASSTVCSRVNNLNVSYCTKVGTMMSAGMDSKGRCCRPKIALTKTYIHSVKIISRRNLRECRHHAAWSARLLGQNDKLLNAIKAEDKNMDAKLVIEKGLKPESGNTSTEEDIVNPFTITSPYVLSIQQVEPEHNGTDGTVKVTNRCRKGGFDDADRHEP